MGEVGIGIGDLRLVIGDLKRKWMNVAGKAKTLPLITLICSGQLRVQSR
jgi:hypothetical protein